MRRLRALSRGGQVLLARGRSLDYGGRAELEPVLTRESRRADGCDRADRVERWTKDWSQHASQAGNLKISFCYWG
jgi:hypothetical protein